MTPAARPAVLLHGKVGSIGKAASLPNGAPKLLQLICSPPLNLNLALPYLSIYLCHLPIQDNTCSLWFPVRQSSRPNGLNGLAVSSEPCAPRRKLGTRSSLPLP